MKSRPEYPKPSLSRFEDPLEGFLITPFSQFGKDALEWLKLHNQDIAPPLYPHEIDELVFLADYARSIDDFIDKFQYYLRHRWTRTRYCGRPL